MGRRWVVKLAKFAFECVFVLWGGLWEGVSRGTGQRYQEGIYACMERVDLTPASAYINPPAPKYILFIFISVIAYLLISST